MYSLYRAWLSTATSPPTSSAASLSLPATSSSMATATLATTLLNNNNNRNENGSSTASLALRPAPSHHQPLMSLAAAHILPLDLTQSMQQQQQQEEQRERGEEQHHNTLMMSSAPDVNLQVGPTMTHFAAHKSVLTVHSGFFKAAIGALSNGNSGNPQHSPIGPILVPNINVDEFSSLLTFMYTGLLDLNLSNIYSILLATHILHMPRALEMCRSFLLQHQQQQQQHFFSTPTPINHSNNNNSYHSNTNSSSNGVIKPIPNRYAFKQALLLGGSNESAPSSITTTTTTNTFPSVIGSGGNSVFKRVNNKMADVNLTPANNTSNHDNETARMKNNKEKQNADAKNVKNKQKHKSTNVKGNKNKMASSGENNTVAPGNETTNSNKVIVDVACCDGPVRFHRVINKNYGFASSNSSNNQQTITVAIGDNDCNNMKMDAHAMNKAMVANIRRGDAEKQMKNNENIGNTVSPTNLSGDATTMATSCAEMYTCHYCNHTFKSHYCFRKHARRHLIPLDGATATTSNAAASTASLLMMKDGYRDDDSGGRHDSKQHHQQLQPQQVSSGVANVNNNNNNKREVRLLDMNVQYYPCKTCGCKFPSYYFVHKHRKLCHPEEMSIMTTATVTAVATITTVSDSNNGASGTNECHDAQMTVGDSCQQMTVGDSRHQETVGDSCQQAAIDDSCQQVPIDQQMTIDDQQVPTDDNCQKMTIDDTCQQMTQGESCQTARVNDSCQQVSFPLEENAQNGGNSTISVTDGVTRMLNGTFDLCNDIVAVANGSGKVNNIDSEK